MKLGKKLLYLSIVFFFLIFYLFFYRNLSFAQIPSPQPVNLIPTPPTPCQGSSGCPANIPPNYTCASSYEDWLNDKTKNYWVNDDEVTYLGKQGERARQFVYWVLTHRSVDNALNIVKVWQQNRTIVYAFIVLIAAIFGFTLIIQRKYFQTTSFDIKEKIAKVGLLLLYTTFSFSITLFIIQLTDILSSFYIEKLGVEKIFNIFFLPQEQGVGSSLIQSSEQAYISFQGCRNLNINLTESIRTSMFLIKITNLTYFILGVMLLLRKIILWFLLVISPFLAILAPFVFIRNIGWIWVGVFFQWVFYGPLLALFLGLLATIWNLPPHIPFNFDFSRINNPEGFIYQTGINILYGGPAQTLSFANTSNYIDTFAEYIISLLMLWAVIFFPWWLLRIFRDYCCEGIMAMKNILISIYDQMRGGPPFAPAPIPPSTPTTISTALKIPKEVEIPIKVRLETMEEIKKAKTEEITRSLNISISRLTDIAYFETNKNLRETVVKNLNYLQNPTQAATATDRQKYMNIRTELFNRAVKEDKIAKQVLSSISTSKIEQIQRKQELIQSISKMLPAVKIETIKVKMAAAGKEEKVPAAPPEKPIEQLISIPPTVPIEDYEQVKRMWKSQYEKGEVPVTENITSRQQWVENDIIFITNTLNKLLSPNKQLQQEGLDDIGYILPIFLVNNLTGEQLVVYLKAKLEAAKEVKEEKEKEKEIAEKLKAKTEEEMVEVEKPKEKEVEKTMEMKEELKSETRNPKSETMSKT